MSQTTPRDPSANPPVLIVDDEPHLLTSAPVKTAYVDTS